MMNDKIALLDALSELFEYPGEGFADAVAAFRAIADGRRPGSGDRLADLERRARGMSRGEVEEMFTRTFEINPVCALEVGWHVYGEEYERGALMVRLRQELRRHDVAEGNELPDHLTHVLRLLGRLDSALADDLAGRYVLPSLSKMIDALSGKECPYEGLLQTAHEIVDAEHDAIEIAPQRRRSDPPGSLLPFPMTRHRSEGPACGPTGGCS